MNTRDSFIIMINWVAHSSKRKKVYVLEFGSAQGDKCFGKSFLIILCSSAKNFEKKAIFRS